jgi:hypothetical protein
LLICLARADAELHSKREAQRDPEFELEVAKWVERAVGEPLADVNDLWLSLRSGVVLCNLVNKIVPNTVPRFAKTKLLPLMEMDNIQLYLKACWNLGVPSGDFFIVSDLYQNKSILQVIQNLVSLSRVAAGLGFPCEPIVAGNSGKDRVKNWETVVSGGGLKHVDDLLAAGSPAERITQLTVELGQVKHEAGTLRSDLHNLTASMKELQQQQRADRERWTAEKQGLQARLKKFAPIDDGGEGAEGSLALKALELSFKEELEGERAKQAALEAKLAATEAKHEELKKKYSAAAAELSKLRFDAKSGIGAQAAPSAAGANNSSGSLGAPSFVPPAAEAKKPAWMQKVADKKAKAAEAEREQPRSRTRTRTIMAQAMVEPRTPLPTIVAPGGAVPLRERTATDSAEEVHYRGRLNTMMQVKTTTADGSEEAAHESGFFFNAENLDADGLDYLTEQVEILFGNTAVEDDASTIVNEMLFGDSGRRTFTFVLKEKLRQLNFQKVALDTGPFLQVLSLINSCLTGMQLDGQIDYIAMTFLLGVSRSIYTTGSRSQMEEYICDHLRDHSVWADVNFWDQHFFDVVGKAFKKKFANKSLSDALSGGWSEEHLKFLAQFIASFAHEMTRWSLAEEALGTFLSSVFDRLQVPTKHQDVTRAYLDKLTTSHNTKAIADSQRMRHVSMVMSTAQAARIMGNLKGATAGAAGNKQSHDTNILQGWLKRKVHVMWISEWVDQVGLHLNFREFKQGTNKRIVINLSQITKVEVRSNDPTLKDSRVIYIEAGDIKVTVAPVKDTQEEIDYWVGGLRRMQGRFNVAPGTKRGESPRVPRVDPATRRSQTPLNTSSGPPLPVFAAASKAESTLRLLATKEQAPLFGLAAPGLTAPVACVFIEPKLQFKRGDAVVATIDLSDMTHMPEVDGKVIRLHTKQGPVELSEFDPPEAQEKWLKALTAFKKKKGASAVSTEASSSGALPPAISLSSGAIPAAAATTAAAAAVVAHTYKMGDMVWCEFVDDKLWYRGVIYLLNGDAFKVVFIEYGNTQDSGPKQVRPIDDPAMLALSGRDLAFVTSPKSIDAARPMTVQIPQGIAQDLRRGTRAGTIMKLDPKTIVKQLQEERGGDEEEPQQQQQQPPPRHVASAPAVVPSSPPAMPKREETEPDLFDWALRDDDVDEADLLAAEELEADQDPGDVDDAPEVNEDELLADEEEPEEPEVAAVSVGAQLKKRLASQRLSTLGDSRSNLAPSSDASASSEEQHSSTRKSTVTALLAARGRASTGDPAAAAARVRERLEQRRKDKESRGDSLLDEDDEEPVE